MKKPEIVIKENSLDDAILVSKQISEFEDAYQQSDYENKFKDAKHLILTAYLNDKPVGFKVGYETQTKQIFYSWMGGVLPKYRQLGIAEKLLKYQEQWAVQTGYLRISVKTRTKYKAMIKLLHRNGYTQMGIIPFSPYKETRILFDKKL